MGGITAHTGEGMRKYTGKHLLPSSQPESQESQDEHEWEPCHFTQGSQEEAETTEWNKVRMVSH